MNKLLFTFAVIIVSLVAGYAIQRAARQGRVRLDETVLVSLRRRSQWLALFGCIPLSAMLSLWGLPEPEPRLLALPLLGLASWICGSGLAIALGRLLRLDRARAGSLFCCGAFSNIGAVGSLTCVVFLGESAIALVALYRLFEELFFFGIGMPVARWYGSGGKPTLRAFRPDPMLGAVIGALLCGIALNRLGVPRPAVCGIIASASMVLGTALLLAAIGMGLRLSSLGAYRREALGVAAIKFVGVPLVVAGLAWTIGYGAIDGGLPLKTVLIVSAMPVAMNALMPPSLYGLDLDLANACWIFSTAALVVVLPALLAITAAL